MIREFSAGGIVYKQPKTKDQRLKADGISWLICQHSQHKGWVFPKGFIGDRIQGESIEDTAVREVKEETGVKAKIVQKLEEAAGYFYVWKGEKRFKTVYYFIMEYVSGNIKDHDFEMQDVEWLPTDQILGRLTYKSDKQAFGEALQLIKRIKK